MTDRSHRGRAKGSMQTVKVEERLPVLEKLYTVRRSIGTAEVY